MNWYKCNIGYTGEERSAHTRTWNLKAALGPKLCKVNQQDQHANVKQHVLAEKVPKTPTGSKDQVSSLRNILSKYVQSLASPDTQINEDALGGEVPW